MLREERSQLHTATLKIEIIDCMMKRMRNLEGRDNLTAHCGLEG